MQELAAEECRKGSKLTPAIPSAFEAIYYELEIVLEVTVLPKGIPFVLSIPMISKSTTYSVFQAEPLYQPKDNGKTASVYQPKILRRDCNRQYKFCRVSRVYVTTMHGK